MKKRIKSLARVLLPSGSRQRILAGKIKQNIIGKHTTKREYSYEKWIKENEPLLFKYSLESLKKLRYQPTISILTPCYNTRGQYINQLVASVKSQTYTKWELCLIDASNEDRKSFYIKEIALSDKRIKYTKTEKNLGISGNTNIALEAATGDYVAFLDHDDTLSPHALAEIVKILNQKPETDLIYSDEDKLSDSGKNRLSPFFKPDWSPELLLGVNYITHFVVARKSIADSLYGLRTNFDGAQDYDFLLRVTELTDKIEHIPKILYHWRLAQGSTSKNVNEKDYATIAGRQALIEALERRGINAVVKSIPNKPTNYRVIYKLSQKQPTVSIIIPFKDKADLLKQCVISILKYTTYENYDLILVSNNSIEKATRDYLKLLKKNKRCRVFYWDHPFNYAKINNFGRSQSTSEYIVLLNNDTKVLTSSWLEELIGCASQRGIGAVGPLLLYPNDLIQHAGVIVGMKTTAGHVFRYKLPDDWTDFGSPAWPRNYLAVTGACLAIKTSKYDEVGGLDEGFIISGNDVALGIKLYEKGYRNVYWPFVKLYHYESMSVRTYNGIQSDYDLSMEYYKPYLKWQDPYFNPNLDIMNEQVKLRETYE